jgi:hypothetical protein
MSLRVHISEVLSMYFNVHIRQLYLETRKDRNNNAYGIGGGYV